MEYFSSKEFSSLKVDDDGFDSNLESVPNYSVPNYGDRLSLCLKSAIASDLATITVLSILKWIG
jgi:hypothetical protein